MSSIFKRSAALFSAIAGLTLAGGAGMPAISGTPSVAVSTSSKRKKGLFNGLVYPSAAPLFGRKSQHQTVAQAKRQSAKRRNQLRNKAALMR